MSKAFLVRVGADRSEGGGSWNGPVDTPSGNFLYVAIPETEKIHRGMEKPYAALEPYLTSFGISLPSHLRSQHMHLDPDFEYLTYGDQGKRAKQLNGLSKGDTIVFYSGLKGINREKRLVYALIGSYIVDSIVPATSVSDELRDINAHSRRILKENATDTIFRARPGVSGRFKQCLPIGEWRDRAYRVKLDILEEWGGLSVKNGYLQRSGTLPEFKDPNRFLRWLESKNPNFVQSNN